MKLHDIYINFIGSVEDDQLILNIYDGRDELKTDVLADEESFSSEPPLYFTSTSHFISPVFVACLVAHNLSNLFKNYKFTTVVRTKYDIINYEDMVELWDAMKIKVLHKQPLNQQLFTLSPEKAPELYGALNNLMEWISEDLENGICPVIKDEQPPSRYDWLPAEMMEITKASSNPEAEDYEEENEDEELFDEGMDFDETDNEEEQEEKPLPSLESVMSELNTMEGMEDVKEEFMNICSMVRFNCLRRKAGIKCDGQNRFHAIFMGNPGTGKTTVARMMGRFFYKLGVLSTGTVHSHSRTDLVARYIGATEERMTQILQESRGGILFIDEAYALFDGREDDKADFGNTVLQSLLAVLTEPDPDMIIILAGYPAEMEKMLNSNPGLRSRFPFTLTFDDYNADTLFRIALKSMEQNEFVVDESTKLFLHDKVAECWKEREQKHFANARWIENMMLHVMLAASRRINFMQNPNPSREELTLLKTEDIEKGFQSYANSLKRKGKVQKQIGFSAC